ncbi:hypothetical protein [Haladaptatus salinisoli]|uniref:hypothetical protein n=1 Tax=Haladaptatus salinisoli TaxID=2884876 RepID=UPI001D0ADD71|nr:hypothetical protein [Haladaptatus salinisoli]
MVYLIGSVVGFVVSLLIGALGIYIGARVVTGTDDYGYALITAIVGSLVGGIVAVLIGWLLGWLVVLVAWVWVINWRYPGGWGNAIGIGLIAWVSVVAITYALAILNVLTFRMLGIPSI